MDLSPEIQQGIQRLGYQFVPFLMAVVAHEFGHGLMAYWWGDKTAEESGRLTLNPIPHIDPIGTLLFPMMNMAFGMTVMFGWARPVPIDPRRFRKFRPGLFWVSLAGPLMNFIMAVICGMLFCAISKWVSPTFMFYKEFGTMLEFGVYINYGLGIFNLLPLPPLDGSKMVESFLSFSAMQKYERIARFSPFILLALIFTGAIHFIGVPILFMGDLTLSLLTFAFRV